jgi:AcrR family transcriptional regulator
METKETGIVSSGTTVSTGRGRVGDGSDADLRRRIVTYARRRFLADGFSTVRTEDLSRELGISKKTLYRLYDSKVQIVTEVARAFIADIDAVITPYFESDGAFPEKFGGVVQTIATHVGSISGHFLNDIARHAPDVWEEIDRFRKERVLGRISGLIVQGKREGYVHPEIDPDLLVTIIYAVAQNVFTPERLMELGVGPREVVSSVLRLFGFGLLTEKGRAHLERRDHSDEKDTS